MKLLKYLQVTALYKVNIGQNQQQLRVSCCISYDTDCTEILLRGFFNRENFDSVCPLKNNSFDVNGRVFSLLLVHSFIAFS